MTCLSHKTAPGSPFVCKLCPPTLQGRVSDRISHGEIESRHRLPVGTTEIFHQSCPIIYVAYTSTQSPASSSVFTKKSSSVLLLKTMLYLQCRSNSRSLLFVACRWFVSAILWRHNNSSWRLCRTQLLKFTSCSVYRYWVVHYRRKQFIKAWPTTLLANLNVEQLFQSECIHFLFLERRKQPNILTDIVMVFLMF